MIRKCTERDFDEILTIINDAAIAYKGIIPADRWHEPYMSAEEFAVQIAEGVEFLCYVDDAEVIGVMGVQDKDEVRLIRHAYVRTTSRNRGIGSILLNELIKDSTKPILIGTWSDASWAIRFYEKHGFRVVEENVKNRLLETYWSIPERQIETSVVLGDAGFFDGAKFSIKRHWKGVAKSEEAENYVQHLLNDTFPKLQSIDGFVSASIQRRNTPIGVEFLIETEWNSMDAIKNFAGADAEHAVVPEIAQNMMVKYDARVTHYEVIAQVDR